MDPDLETKAGHHGLTREKLKFRDKIDELGREGGGTAGAELVEVEGVAAHLDGLGVLEAERTIAFSEKTREKLVPIEEEEEKVVVVVGRWELTGLTTRAMAEKLRAAAAISFGSMARGRGVGGDGTARGSQKVRS